MVYTLDGQSVCVTDNPADFGESHRALPLYTTPPAAQRTWVGLTDEEIRKSFQIMYDKQENWPVFANSIEAKLKEKNT